MGALEFAVGVAGDSAVRHHAAMLLASALLDRAAAGRAARPCADEGSLCSRRSLSPAMPMVPLRVRAALFWAQEAVVGQQYSAAARAYRMAIDELPSPLWWASMITRAPEAHP